MFDEHYQSALRGIANRFMAVFVLSISSQILCPSDADAQVLENDGTPVLVGARNVPRALDLCNDYASKTDYAGNPYRIVEEDRVVTRHEGVDFCAPAGTPVIAPVSGLLVWVVKDHPLRGGQVLIQPGFSVRIDNTDDHREPVYFGILHMTPAANLVAGTRVHAGQVIGHVQEAGPPEIGSRSHLHFTARICKSHKCHIDPNLFWKDGPGQVACFDAAEDLPRGRMVAPISC